MNSVSHTTGKSEKRIKRKFNFIDFLVILVILAIVGIIIYVFSPWSRIEKLWSNDQVELTYFVEIKDVNPEDIDLIKSGDSVINSVTKNSLGTVAEITDIESAYVYDYVMNEDGKMTCVILENPKKYNVTVKITAYADFKEDVGYSVNGCRIAIGEMLSLRLPKYACSGYCTQIYS